MEWIPIKKKKLSTTKNVGILDGINKHAHNDSRELLIVVIVINVPQVIINHVKVVNMYESYNESYCSWNTFNLHFLPIDVLMKPETSKYNDCISLLSWCKQLWSICNSLFILYKYSTNSRSWSIHLYSYWFVYIIYAKHLFDTNTSLIFLKATFCSFPQCQLTFFTNSSFNRAVISDKFGINLPT